MQRPGPTSNFFSSSVRWINVAFKAIAPLQLLPQSNHRFSLYETFMTNFLPYLKRLRPISWISLAFHSPGIYLRTFHSVLEAQRNGLRKKKSINAAKTPSELKKVLKSLKSFAQLAKSQLISFVLTLIRKITLKINVLN